MGNDKNLAAAQQVCDDQSGYEVWRSLPPQDAKVKFEGHVDCAEETYKLTISFEPDMVRAPHLCFFNHQLSLHSLCPHPHISLETFPFLSTCKNLPFINNITKEDKFANEAHPEKNETCLNEGMGPGLEENIPEGMHVGQNVHYTDYSYSYKTTQQVQKATGFKLITIGITVSCIFLYEEHIQDSILSMSSSLLSFQVLVPVVHPPNLIPITVSTFTW